MTADGSTAPRSFWAGVRVRRLSDVGRLVGAATALVSLALLAGLYPGLVRTIGDTLPSAQGGLARTVLSAANVAASLAVLGVLVTVAVDALRYRRFAFTSALIACALGLLVGVVAIGVADVGSNVPVRALVQDSDPSAMLPVTAAVALLVGADLQRQRRWLGPANFALAAALVCALALRSLTGPSAAIAVLFGATAGLAVRVALGVVPARPSADVLLSVLARAGWPLVELSPQDRAAGRVRYTASGAPGEELRVTVVDPDRRGVPLARRAGRLLRLRTAAVGRPALSLRGQLERQALTAALARSAGVATPQVLALLPAGPALVLLERPLVGTPIHALSAPDAALGAVNASAALRRLHDAGLAHGGLSADGIVVLPDGSAGFADLGAAQPAATELQRELDVVALLVAIATSGGAGHAVTALRSAYGTSPTSEARLAALLQPLALLRPVRAAVRGTPLLSELRTTLTGSGVSSAPADTRLERLPTRLVIGVAATTLAAHVLVGQLSEVSIPAALRQARPWWLAVALVGSALTYLGSALALQAFLPKALPLARTALVQLASSFLTLVTPPTVGHIGLNIRYLQRAKVPTADAAACVAVKEAVTVATTVLLLVVCGWLSGISASRPALLPRGNVLAVLVVTAVALALVAVLPPTRRLLRRRLQPLIRRTIPQLLAMASDPRRLATALLGILILNGGYVLALSASLRAFSAALALPALVVVYLAASTIGSAAPTPGGLGAVEAALVGGLTATGVPVAPAVTAVLAFRTATFWLPAFLGWVAFVALQRRGRI